MKKKVYIIWNVKDDRPAIMQGNYSPLLVFLTEEHAQANENAQRALEKDRNDFIIKEMILEDNINS